MSGKSYETFLKVFREMLEAVWLRDFTLTDDMDEFREEWESRDIEDLHAVEAESRKLAESKLPRSNRLSRQDRLHMKYAGRKPGFDEKAVAKRILRRSLQPRETDPTEERSVLTQIALARIAPPKAWGTACYTVKRALRDVHAFRSVTPTPAQRRILHAAALALCSDLTEKAISEASGVSEKTLRQWLKVLSQYEVMLGRYEYGMQRRREDRIRRHLLAEGFGSRGGKR